MSTAPVEPAEKRPSASPARTAEAARTMLASFFLRTALAGCSDISMTSVVTRGRARSCEAAKGSTTSAAPATSTSRSASSARIPLLSENRGSSPYEAHMRPVYERRRVA